MGDLIHGPWPSRVPEPHAEANEWFVLEVINDEWVWRAKTDSDHFAELLTELELARKQFLREYERGI